MEPTSSLNRGERKKGSSLVTGSEVQSQASGASCFITTDSEKSLVSRQASQVEQIELRTYVFLDSLQPQLAAYMGESGEDIQLSPAARKLIPYSFECKNHEKLNIWSALEQAEEYAHKGTPVVVFKRNRSKTYAVIELKEFVDLIK